MIQVFLGCTNTVLTVLLLLIHFGASMIVDRLRHDVAILEGDSRDRFHFVFSWFKYVRRKIIDTCMIPEELVGIMVATTGNKTSILI